MCVCVCVCVCERVCLWVFVSVRVCVCDLCLCFVFHFSMLGWVLYFDCVGLQAIGKQPADFGSRVLDPALGIDRPRQLLHAI